MCPFGTISSFSFSLLIISPLIYLLARFDRRWASAFLALASGLGLYKLATMYGEWGLPSQSFEIIPNVTISFTNSPLQWYFAFIGLGIMLTIFLFEISWLSKSRTPSAHIFFEAVILASLPGFFMAGDLMTLYIFFELMSWAAFFIVSQASEKSEKAARTFIAMNTTGAMALLYVLFLLYTRFSTLNIEELRTLLPSVGAGFNLVIFALFVFSGLIKAGSFPLHTWLRKTHGNAPDSFSAVLSGYLIKYGSFVVAVTTVIFPSLLLFSNAPHFMGLPLPNYILAVLGGVSIIVGTLMAIKQQDAKMLIAYSSVSHAGYIVMALAMVSSYSVAGGLLHVLVHALAAAGMFLSMAAVKYRTGTTNMSELGGLVDRMPVTFATYLISIISTAGIPPMVGFVSKWLIYQSTITGGFIFLSFAAFFGSIGSFLYVFRPLATVFFGQRPKRLENVREVPFIMQLPMIIISALTVIFGVLPSIALKPIAETERYYGIKPVSFSFSEIQGALGSWNSVLVFFVFMLGFIMAAVIFYLARKSVRVGLLENYTAGEIPREIINSPELYHYAHNFYRPVERLYEHHPSLEDFYETALGENLKKFGVFLKTLFYNHRLDWYLYVSILTILFLWWLL